MIVNQWHRYRKICTCNIFVGLSSFTTEEPFDASLMVSIRYRLGKDVREEFNQLVLHRLVLFHHPQQLRLTALQTIMKAIVKTTLQILLQMLIKIVIRIKKNRTSKHQRILKTIISPMTKILLLVIAESCCSMQL